MLYYVYFINKVTKYKTVVQGSTSVTGRSGTWTSAGRLQHPLSYLRPILPLICLHFLDDTTGRPGCMAKASDSSHVSAERVSDGGIMKERTSVL